MKFKIGLITFFLIVSGVAANCNCTELENQLSYKIDVLSYKIDELDLKIAIQFIGLGKKLITASVLSNETCQNVLNGFSELPTKSSLSVMLNQTRTEITNSLESEYVDELTNLADLIQATLGISATGALIVALVVFVLFIKCLKGGGDEPKMQIRCLNCGNRPAHEHPA